jgi:hypothetical protein
MYSQKFKALAAAVAILTFTLTDPATIFSQNPNSGLTSTGQTLTVEILTPADGEIFNNTGDCVIDVTGTATIDTGQVRMTILYVLDISGSTGNPAFPTFDINGDGTINSSDDYNGDGEPGQTLDAEIAASIALNQSLSRFPGISVGVAGYASKSSTADISPIAGDQIFASPPNSDDNGNQVSDLEEVLRSMDSDPFTGAEIGEFTPIDRDFFGSSTNYKLALQTILEAFAGRPGDEAKVVYFLSDGRNQSDDPFDEELSAIASAGITVNAIGTRNANPEILQDIAARTGGEFHIVENTGELDDLLPEIPIFVGISGVAVNGEEVELDDEGHFATQITVPHGAHNIEARATAGDETSITASIGIECQEDMLPPDSCRVEIITPPDGAVVCGDSVEVTLRARVFGGTPPISSVCYVNDIEVMAEGDTVSVVIPLAPETRHIIAMCIFSNDVGETVCSDTVEVKRPKAIECTVDILSPDPDSVFCGDSLKVIARMLPVIPGFEIQCDINGHAAMPVAGQFVATIPLDPGENLITATCTVKDSCGNRFTCSDSMVVTTPSPPQCEVELSVLQDSSGVCSDSVLVRGSTIITGGGGPLTIVCSVNGIPATVVGSEFFATVPLDSAITEVIARCTVTDVCGITTVCDDTLMVPRTEPPVCEIEIIEPIDGGAVCGDSLKVIAADFSEGGLYSSCTINGIPAQRVDSLLYATIALKAGENLIVVQCQVEDRCGNLVICSDSVTVFRDGAPPSCAFNSTPEGIEGMFFDDGGIAEIRTVEIRNGTLILDADFRPGDRAAGFRIEKVNPNRNIFFSIDAIDMCGNVHNCDPVFLSLSTAADTREHSFTFPSVDRFLQIENRGIAEISIELNGHEFHLYADARRASEEPNAYEIPFDGTFTIDLQPYLNQGDNQITLVFSGQPGTTAEIMIAGESRPVDQILDIEELPTEFALAQNYPNPFNPSTRIQYDIPDRLSESVQVTVRVYNLLGDLVATIEDTKRQPGQYSIEWDGTSLSGERVSSGIYIYQMVAGGFRSTKRMLVLK